MKRIIIAFGLVGLIYACGSEKEEKSSKKEEVKETTPNYRDLGLDITNTAQKTLLKHVGQAMKMGGPNAAIQYCNINAMTITDSLSQAHKVKISRVSERNRNESNHLADADLPFWNHYKSGEANVQMADTVVNMDGKHIYYRPIYIANPACLNCHGQSGTDILEGTIAKLDEFYPNDKARDYNLGELRGMWKLEFEGK